MSEKLGSADLKNGSKGAPPGKGGLHKIQVIQEEAGTSSLDGSS